MAKHGRYKIVRKVADGGMAEIFLATQTGHEGFHKPVILKRIHSSIYADPQFRNMFIDEAHISMGLSHSNIVQILDLGVGQGRYFLVMEVVDGWDLGRVLHRAANVGLSLPRELGLYIVAEVCRALAYAHGKVNPVDGRPLGIVHRDVSPQNILLSEQGEVKLTDFGIAKAMNKREHTGTGVVKGKVAFMSPEQALGKSIDARSDLFAVGTVLYQLMTRVRPFEGPTDLEILLRVQHAEFKPADVIASDLPAEVSSIITTAMQLDPELRFQSAEEMLTAIEDVLRSVLRPVGQTELKKWLAALSARDGLQPMSRGQATPVPGRVAGTGERVPGTGEMEGKDVELTDTSGEVDAEEATSLASIESGEMRSRVTRQRAGAEELSLPVPEGSESAMSGRHAPLQFPLPLGDTEERPRHRRGKRSGGFGLVIFTLVILGGAAFAGRYFGLLREKWQAVTGLAPAVSPAPESATPAPANEPPPSAKEEDRSDKSKDDKAKDQAKAKSAEAGGANEEGPREPGDHHARGEKAERVEKGEKAEKTEKTEKVEKVQKPEKSESARRIEALRNQMAPDPSLDPAPPPPPPAPSPSSDTP